MYVSCLIYQVITNKITQHVVFVSE